MVNLSEELGTKLSQIKLVLLKREMLRQMINKKMLNRLKKRTKHQFQ